MLDSLSVSVMTALVVLVGGAIFIIETLIRRDEGAGRVWALAFLAGMLTTVCYLAWGYAPSAWWIVGVGNAAFVTTTGCMWLGCRRYNARAMRVSAVIVLVGALGAAAAAIIEGPDGGGWAGALWMFVVLALFAGAGAVESVSGEMGRTRTARALTVVLALQAAFYLARSIFFVVAGPESAAFQLWFSTVSTSFLTVTLTIVALVVTSVLRAGRAQLRNSTTFEGKDARGDGILSPALFARIVGDVLSRAQRRHELGTIISVRLEDLEQISSAFGSETVRALLTHWREAVRRLAPSDAIIGEDGSGGLLLGMLVDSSGDARRHASFMYAGLFERLGTVTGGIIPVVGVGLALTISTGYDVDVLSRVARAAAQRAADRADASVVIGGAEDQLSR